MSQPPELLEPVRGPGEEMPPRHGFQGDRGAVSPRLAVPLGLSIALSRESGARGGTIGRLVGQRLGWQVYDEELLEYMSQDVVARQELWSGLSPASARWLEDQLSERKQRLPALSQDEAILSLVRLILALAAQGQVVLVGRGAGWILPPATTLRVRIVAPLEERIGYIGQWMRLPAAEAAEKVRMRDEHRREFVAKHFLGSPTDVHQYDLLLNSSVLGVDACVDLIARAAQLRSAQMSEGR